MAKDPAFLFYPNDYIGGTMGMTFEEKGAYMDLLMMQFNRGHMSGHMIGQVVGQTWDKIQHKFVQDENGLWYNERLELEIKRRKAFTDSRKNNLKGVNQHTKKVGHKGGHMTNHMEDENVNVNKDINIDERFKKIWNEWIDYRKKINKSIKPVSEQKAYNKLIQLSNNSPPAAQKIIDQSIANGWQGLFELKTTQNTSSKAIKTKDIDYDEEPKRNY